jgi:hypothetical protein
LLGNGEVTGGVGDVSVSGGPPEVGLELVDVDVGNPAKSPDVMPPVLRDVELSGLPPSGSEDERELVDVEEEVCAGAASPLPRLKVGGGAGGLPLPLSGGPPPVHWISRSYERVALPLREINIEGVMDTCAVGNAGRYVRYCDQPVESMERTDSADCSGGNAPIMS